MTVLEKRPGPFLKFFFKFPVWLHKIGFGGWERLIGAQWMLLTTTGRKSGKPRETMVDVMDYDKAADTYYIEVAYGKRADWFRNIQANPFFEAKVGRRKFKARASVLSNENAADMLVKFYREKPAYTRSVMAMVGMKFGGEDELRAIASKLMLLAIHPEKQ
ncbi:MAG: nitroreductase family deazaflavin-dependent oxidoreductase [Chloroflexi bacterium]|nr:nitroreductase family deazaflavin-dependent oxidoreductase [Chloroflexota bacterium]